MQKPHNHNTKTSVARSIAYRIRQHQRGVTAAELYNLYSGIIPENLIWEKNDAIGFISDQASTLVKMGYATCTPRHGNAGRKYFPTEKLHTEYADLTLRCKEPTASPETKTQPAESYEDESPSTKKDDERIKQLVMRVYEKTESKPKPKQAETMQQTVITKPPSIQKIATLAKEKPNTLDELAFHLDNALVFIKEHQKQQLEKPDDLDRLKDEIVNIEKCLAVIRPDLAESCKRIHTVLSSMS